MNKFVSMIMVAAATLALAGCGGSGSGPLTGSSSDSSGATSHAQKLSLLSSVPQMPSDGSKPATITALVEDANNNVVSSAPVTFQASSGALTVAQGTTGASGTATATLSTGGDPTDRTIKVTATSGSTTATVSVSVSGTKLTLSGPTSLVLNNTGSYSTSLVDSSGNGISGQTVTVTSAKDNTINPGTFTTSSSGQGSFTLKAVNSGTDTLTAAAAGLQSTQDVSVSSDSFTFTSPAANQNIDIGTNATVTVTWQNSGNAVANTPITFAATRGTLSTASPVNTDPSGSASVTISSLTAGPSVISASGTDGSGNNVSAQIVVNFIATTPSALNVQSSPSTISTQGQSTITATVRDANNNLVQGQTVDFAITQDSTGGTLSAASAETNAQGQATTTYTATATTSAANGVVIGASIPGTSIAGSTSLTVAGQTVSLSLGTGNIVNKGPNSDTQYSLPYTVQAVDAAGNPVNGVNIAFKVQSLGYVKGCRVWGGATGTSCVNPEGTGTVSGGGAASWDTLSNTSGTDGDVYALDGIDGCITEDADDDGIEDNNYNNDNNIIWPGQVVSTDVSSAMTASNGTATVNLIYPKDHAYYVAIMLTATATVQGTQSSTSVEFWLPGTTTDFQTESNAPPGPYSPYGTASTCASPN